MKAYRGSRSIVPLILYLGIRWKSVVNFVPQLRYSLKEPRYPLARRLVGLKSQSGWTGENALPLPGF
jgi:hypothetical protein